MARNLRFSVAAALLALSGGYAGTVAAQEEDAIIEEIVVVGSRIARKDFVASSPVTTVEYDQMVRYGDVTMDQFLNTLPQVNPAGGTTSNNPGNNGQSNVNLRGLGPNRNLVLIDGRRAMPSQSDLSVDINVIPAALIDSVEILSGGAGAVYGADAVAGAVNVKLKKDFEGFDIFFGRQDHIDKGDAEENHLSLVWGANFSDGRGNATFALDHADRDAMVKSQRDFSAQATSTTSFLPEGRYVGPAIPQEAIDDLFETYGVARGSVGSQGDLGFNLDGTLFSRGVFNDPRDVENFRYPLDDGAVNENLYPDFYSYNFDFVNLLRLPLDRDSIMTTFEYEFDSGVETFVRFNWTEYDADTALAPTPIPTVGVRAPGEARSDQAVSTLVNPGGAADFTFVVPSTNPFIPNDLRFLLNSRTGDDPNLVGAGPNEAFRMRQRTLDAGLRLSSYSNTVTQFMGGARGPFPGLEENWEWEFSYSQGRTRIVEGQSGNIDTNRLQLLLEAADGGDSICAGGFNPFGRQGLSAECVDYLEVSSALTTEFSQEIVELLVSGELGELAGGPIGVVLGYQYRLFDYDFDPGPSGGPISGFNSQSPAGGKNDFNDFFFELLFPLVSDAGWAQSVDIGVGYRYSIAQFKDDTTGIQSDKSKDSAYKLEANWVLNNNWMFRGSYQRAVRAPNFDELFDGTGAAPQIFDPCSSFTEARNGPDGDAILALCEAQDLVGAVNENFVATPGNQTSIVIDGNPALDPETADTYTVGAVWNLGNRDLTMSLDYYNIRIKDPIITPNVNLFIADCHNYYGNNPNYDINYPNCSALFRAGDILAVLNPETDTGNYLATNGGKIKGSGMDFAMTWGMNAGPGYLNLQWLLNWVHEAKQSDGDGLPLLDYAGTVAYFGADLGQSFPEFRWNLTGTYTWNDWLFDARIRWIDSMDNRASVQYPGETTPEGVSSATYVDLGAQWTFLENFTIRAGVNNLFDEDPQTYAPNVQSGTDPSLYDVIGRRYHVSMRMRF